MAFLGREARGSGGNRPGWGGPAYGNSGNRPPRPRTAADAKKSREIARDPLKMAEIELKKMAKEEKIASLTDFQVALALNMPDHEGRVHNADLSLRLSASAHALDRLEGKPRQVNENQNRDMTLEAMVAAAAKMRTRLPE